MAAKCKQMMAAQSEGRGEAIGKPMGTKMREHCEEMTAQSRGRGEPVAKA